MLSFKKNHSLNLDTDNVGKLLFKLAVPQVSVSIITVVVGFISGAIVAGLSIDYFTAYTIASLITSSFFYTLINGIGLGTASLVSRNFTDKEKIRRIILNGLFLALIMFTVYAAFCAVIARPYMSLYSTNPKIINSGVIFILIYMFANLINTFGLFFIHVLQSLGEMVLTSIINLLKIPFTVILNLIFIYGFLFIPSFGLYGIALTAIIVNLFTAVSVFLIIKKRGLLVFNLRFISKIDIKHIISVALPASIQQGLATVLVSGYNLVLKSLDESYVTIIGIFYNWNSINQQMNLSSPLMPIIGFNLSKNNIPRIQKTVRCAVGYTVIMSLSFTLFYIIFPEVCLKAFNCPENILSSAETVFKIFSIYIVPMSIHTVVSNISIALGDATLGMKILIFQTALTLAGGFIMRSFSGLYAIWAFPLAETAAFVIMLIIIYKSKKSSNKILKESLNLNR